MAAVTLSASAAVASMLHAAPTNAIAGAATSPSSRHPPIQKSAFFGKSAALQKAAAPRGAAARSNALQIEASCHPGWERARQRAAAQNVWWARRQARAAGCGSAQRAYADSWAAAVDPMAAMFMGPFWGGRGMMPRRRSAWRGQLWLPQLLREVFQGMRAAARWDVEESDDAWVLRVNLPGFGPEDVKVQVVNDRILQISAKAPAQERDASARAAYRAAAGFETRLPLPREKVAANEVTAEVRRGVLRVTLPKVEAAKRRVVDVAVGGGATSSAEPDKKGDSQPAAESAAADTSATGAAPSTPPGEQPEGGDDEGQIVA